MKKIELQGKIVNFTECKIYSLFKLQMIEYKPNKTIKYGRHLKIPLVTVETG
jgi:hypothetical protein